jgi:hypothetical protein
LTNPKVIIKYHYSIFLIEVIVILVPECVASSHNSTLMHRNFKLVLNYALC